jgi:glycosyltransferase involved in cell wall biosynthesis
MSIEKPVVIFSEDFRPNIGGIATHVQNLAEALVKIGCQVTVISTRKNNFIRNYRHWRIVRSTENGVKIIEIPMVSSPRNFLYEWQIKNRVVPLVESVIKKSGSAVFHWHNIFFDPKVARLIRLEGVKKVFTNHSSQFLAGLDDPEHLSILKEYLSQADVVLTPSEELKEATISCGYPEDQVHFISNGVNTTIYKPDANFRKNTRHKYGLDTKEIAIICPRRVVPKCGVLYLAQSLKHIKSDLPVRVFFTGLRGGELTWRDTIYEESVLKELADLAPNVSVELLEQVPNTEMAALFAGMDICVLPSLVEATSIAGLEAMASGLAMIGTNVGGIPYIIDDGNSGTLVNPENAEAIAEAISALCGDENKLQRFQRSSRERAKDLFDWKMIAKQTAKKYFE